MTVVDDGPPVVVLAQVPIRSEVMVPGVRVESVGLRLEISYAYQADEGGRCSASIVFTGVTAYAQRSEGAAGAWHVEAFDQIVEVSDSAWVAEVDQAADLRGYPHREYHHYMVYLDDIGAVEAIGQSWRFTAPVVIDE